MHILILEDKKSLSKALQTSLEEKGHTVVLAFDGLDGLAQAETAHFDIMVLDIMLPGIDGLAFLKRLREELRSNLPVLVISARSELDDRLAGFEHGADDYLVKPFALAEVEARMRALLKRAMGQTVVDPICRFESLQLDTRSGEATVNGTPVHLTPKAAVLLELLLRTPGQLVRRQKVEQALWPTSVPQPDALRSQVHWLRKALADQGFDRLETIHGIGYRITGA